MPMTASEGPTPASAHPAPPDAARFAGFRPPRSLLVSAFFLALGACVAPTNQAADGARFLAELPEEVVALAAPYQNLREVILRPEDGCYWYRHVGQVETTMLPLRTVAGRPICTQAAVAHAATG